MKKYIVIAVDNTGQVAQPAIMTDPGPRSTGPFNKTVQLFGTTSTGEIVPLKLSPTGELWT